MCLGQFSKRLISKLFSTRFQYLARLPYSQLASRFSPQCNRQCSGIKPGARLARARVATHSLYMSGGAWSGARAHEASGAGESSRIREPGLKDTAKPRQYRQLRRQLLLPDGPSRSVGSRYHNVGIPTYVRPSERASSKNLSGLSRRTSAPASVGVGVSPELAIFNSAIAFFSNDMISSLRS